MSKLAYQAKLDEKIQEIEQMKLEGNSHFKAKKFTEAGNQYLYVFFTLPHMLISLLLIYNRRYWKLKRPELTRKNSNLILKN